MVKKILTFLFIFIYFVSLNTEVFAEYIGGNPGMDFFKKIDTGTVSVQTKMIENELKGSAGKINDFAISNSLGCGNGGTDGCFDSGKDFTYGELQEIVEDGNVAAIISHLKKDYKTITTDKLDGLNKTITLWFTAKEQENLSKEASMSRVGVIGLFNDGDVNNSGYDLMDDLDKIHKIIFDQDVNYEGESNSASSDFGSVLSGDFNNTPSVFDPSATSAGLGGTGGVAGAGGGGAGGGGTGAGGGGTGTPSQSNICTTGASLDGLDSGLIEDINSQLNNGTSGNSSQGGQGSQSKKSGSGSSGKGTSSTQGSGNNGTLGGSSKDSFPCDSFFCIKIEMVMYKQGLLGGGKSETIEGILNKHLKIIDTYAAKSMVQSDMTKNFFSLSILRKLNLPSMLHLGIVVTHMPVPILNLKKESSSKSPDDNGEFEDKVILERTFDQNGIDYKNQNSLNPDKETLDVTNCDNLDTNECVNKLIHTQSVYKPYISNVNIMESKLGEKYKGSLNNDIAEFIGFSNSFKANIEGILATINTMNKTKK